MLIGLHGGFGELPDEWKRHLVLGELAKRFRTADRVLRDDEETETAVDMQQDDLDRAQEVAETLKAPAAGRAGEADPGQANGEADKQP